MAEEKTEITVKELYEKIDKTVNNFVQEINKMLPKTQTTAMSNVIIMHHAVSLKEMARLCVNMHLTALQVEENSEKETEE